MFWIEDIKSSLKCLKIGDKVAELPIIQGGMGVGVSRSSLAGAVAAEGGVGVISTAQIGYDEAGFEKDQAGCNLKAIRKHIWKAREIAKGKGLVGVNIMVALKHYKEHVKEAVECGADVIISGAGLPMNLPELVPEFCRTKIAPIVSSKRAANLILKMWAHRYNRTADLIVVEGRRQEVIWDFPGISWRTGKTWILTRKSGILLHVKRNMRKSLAGKFQW